MKRLLPILLSLLLLCACQTQPTETLPSTAPTAAVPEETAPPTETEPIQISCDPDDGRIVVYMGISSPVFRIYSIAPAGTEAWVRLPFDGDCYQEEAHGLSGMSRFTGETDREDCTLWDLKAEFIPEEFADLGLENGDEYRCELYEDLEIMDGQTRILWQTDGTAPAEPIPETAIFCPNCREAFE